MGIWSIVSFLFPTTATIAVVGWVISSRKAVKSRLLADELTKKLLLCNKELSAAKAQIIHMSEIYKEMDSRRVAAEEKSIKIQLAAAELARRAAENPNAEAAAREAAENIKELLNGIRS